MDVAAWLRNAGLSQYEALFRERGIDDQGLSDLTDADLDKLGIPPGDRRRLLEAIPRGSRLEDMALAAQRRQLTVMFCDLVGSTELSARLDPEDMREVFGAYHRCCAREIETIGGFVAKYMGDGVLAYFGYPQAHENDAERAIQAALMITEAAPRLPTPHGAPLEVRIGIATGLVVVGDLIGAGGAEERAVVGETPNLAARLQDLAGANRVVVSQATHRLAGGLFECRDLGAVTLKGLPRPEQVFEVAGANPDADRFMARQDRGPTSMVGREAEILRSLALWRRCTDGDGQLVGVIGEPGIGKSRFVHEFRRRVADQPHLWLEGGGVQVFGNTPFYAVAQMVRRWLARGERLSPDAYRVRLEQSLGAAGMDSDLNDALPLIADLIGVPTPDRRTPLTLGADEKRRRLIAILAEWLLKSAGGAPLMVAIEDLHWVDPSTLELVDRLIEMSPSAALMLLYTARSDFRPPWPVEGRHTQITLGHLDRDEVRRLVAATASRDLTTDQGLPANFELPSELIETVISRADGVPLFAEELARLIVERNGAGRERAIPSTLSDLLMARLDQLGDAKAVAQVAAVLGGEFYYGLLQAVSGGGEIELRSALARLIRSGVLAASGPGSDTAYAFKHALIQDAAYEALLKSQRRDLHKRAATAIAEQFPDIAASQPEILARHWTGAGQSELALSAWRTAARAASARGAFKEAQMAYEQAIVALEGLPRSQDRDAIELGLQSHLAGVLQITRGYSASETIAATARARRLAERGGDLTAQLRQAHAAWAAASSAGDYLRAAELADDFLPLAQAEGSRYNLGHAHMVQMTSRYRLGDLIGAEGHFTTGESYFAEPAFRGEAGSIAQTFGNAARIAWILGDEARARRRVEHALLVAADNARPYDLAFAQYMAAIMAVLTADPEQAEDLAERSIRLSDQHGFPQFTAISRVVLGRARAEVGRAQEGCALIAEGLRGMTKTRSRVAMTMYLTWLAEAQALDGGLDDALSTLDQALAINPQELFFRPETLRLRGALRLRMGRAVEATTDYRDAMALAKTMGAKLFHQRASAAYERRNDWQAQAC